MLVAQLSDPHLDVHRPQKAGALRRAVEHVLAVPLLPQVVIVTGDIADHGLPEEYAAFQEITEPLPMPVLVIPGNHDDRSAMLSTFGVQGAQALPGFMQYVFNVGAVRLIALDTLLPGQGGGRLDEGRLAWLEERLAEVPDRPTLVFLHHPPLPSGLQVMDALGLRGAPGLEQVIARHPQVGRVLAGHTHTTTSRAFAGTLLLTCAGTDYTWLPDLGEPQQLRVQMQPPTCWLHHWTEEHGWLSYTSVIGLRPLTTLHDGQGWL